MARYSLVIIFSAGFAVLLAAMHLSSADAAELFVRKASPAEKDEKGELFLRGEKSRLRYAQPDSGLQNTKDTIENWTEPASWGLLDPSSRETKKAETQRVTKEQAETQKRIEKQNEKQMEQAKAKAAKEREAAKSKDAQAKEKFDPRAAAAGKGTGGSPRKTVIKRKTDPDEGKPKKLFNSVKDYE